MLPCNHCRLDNKQSTLTKSGCNSMQVKQSNVKFCNLQPPLPPPQTTQRPSHFIQQGFKVQINTASHPHVRLSIPNYNLHTPHKIVLSPLGRHAYLLNESATSPIANKRSTRRWSLQCQDLIDREQIHLLSFSA